MRRDLGSFRLSPTGSKPSGRSPGWDAPAARRHASVAVIAPTEAQMPETSGDTCKRPRRTVAAGTTYREKSYVTAYPPSGMKSHHPNQLDLFAARL